MPVSLGQLLGMVQCEFLMKLQVQGNAELEVYLMLQYLEAFWLCWWQDNSNFDSLIYSCQWTRAKGVYGVRLLPSYAAFRMPRCKIMTPSTCRAQMRQFSDGKMEYISACNIAWPHKTKRGGGSENLTAIMNPVATCERLYPWLCYMSELENTALPSWLAAWSRNDLSEICT